MSILSDFNHFMREDPLMDREDRRKVWGIVLAAIIVPLVSTWSCSARAEISGREDARSVETQRTVSHRASKKPVRVGALKRYAPSRSRGVSLAGVTPILASKAREIVSDCGSVIVSAVSGRGYRSNHPIGRAVDLQGNPSCIYAHLQGWPGGYSTDYNSAPGGKHVHVSYNPGGQEWGIRFVHRHGPVRVARRHHHRVAMVVAP